MGCCLMAIVGALWPRIALVVIWLFYSRVPHTAFHSTLWPVLGFIFLPTTTLAYELIKYNWGIVDSPLSLIIMGLALLHDVGHLGGFRRKRQSE